MSIMYAAEDGYFWTSLNLYGSIRAVSGCKELQSAGSPACSEVLSLPWFHIPLWLVRDGAAKGT